jgi:hypothetical protein
MENSTVDLSILEELQSEVSKIASESAPKNWLSIAAKCVVSQTEYVEKPDTICFLNHTPEPYSLLTRGSISTFTGKAKAGKSTVLALLIADVIRDKKVLWLDTEQGLYYASVTQHYILTVAGLKSSDNLKMLDLRSFNPTDRLNIIEALLNDQHYDLVVLDGLRDVVFDINSSEEATNIITKLMLWSVEHKCHIATVLHQNKGNNDVRGHLGTEAINKSEVVISVAKTDDNPPTAVVVAEYSRGLPFKDFYIKRDPSGVPFVDIDYSPADKTQGNARRSIMPSEYPSEFHKVVLNIIFEHSEEMNSTPFKSAIISALDTASVGAIAIGESKARTFMEYYGQKGYVEIKEKQKGNKTLIKFNLIHKDSTPLVRQIESVNQLSIQLTNGVRE